jgi:hypothetical protein
LGIFAKKKSGSEIYRGTRNTRHSFSEAEEIVHKWWTGKTLEVSAVVARGGSVSRMGSERSLDSWIDLGLVAVLFSSSQNWGW